MIKLTVHQNNCFKEPNFFKGRYRVLMGSAGSGKSVNVAQDYIVKLGDSKYKGANLLVIRKTDVNHRTSTYAELVGAIYRIYGKYAEKLWQIKQSPLEIRNKKTGNTIIFRGVADERQRERLKSITAPGGGKITWIWCEEATELLKNDFDVLDTRLRGALPNENLYYQITLTFNPVSASHWVKGRFFDQTSVNTLAHKSTYLDNAYVDQAYREMMERLRINNPEYYQIYGLGEWGETGGLILPGYKVKEFDCDPYTFDAIALGTDFGFNHAHATLALGWKDGVVYIMDEVWVKQKEINEIAKILDDRLAGYKYATMYCDSSSPEQIKVLRGKGWMARTAKKGPGSVNAQIDWLKGTDLVIHPRCVKTIWEASQWKWQTDKRTGEFLDEPVNIDDDAMAALRYGVEAWRKGASAVSLGAKPKGW